VSNSFIHRFLYNLLNETWMIPCNLRIITDNDVRDWRTIHKFCNKRQRGSGGGSTFKLETRSLLYTTARENSTNAQESFRNGQHPTIQSENQRNHFRESQNQRPARRGAAGRSAYAIMALICSRRSQRSSGVTYHVPIAMSVTAPKMTPAKLRVCAVTGNVKGET